MGWRHWGLRRTARRGRVARHNQVCLTYALQACAQADGLTLAHGGARTCACPHTHVCLREHVIVCLLACACT